MTDVAKKPLLRPFIVVFVALAAFCFVMAGSDGIERIQTLRVSERAVGEVTAALRSAGNEAPLVRFKTADGAVVTVTGQAMPRLFRLQPGDAVPVLYDPRMPQQAVLASFAELWLPLAAWAGFGLLAALAAYGAGRFSRRSG